MPFNEQNKVWVHDYPVEKLTLRTDMPALFGDNLANNSASDTKSVEEGINKTKNELRQSIQLGDKSLGMLSAIPSPKTVIDGQEIRFYFRTELAANPEDYHNSYWLIDRTGQGKEPQWQLFYLNTKDNTYHEIPLEVIPGLTAELQNTNLLTSNQDEIKELIIKSATTTGINLLIYSLAEQIYPNDIAKKLDLMTEVLAGINDPNKTISNEAAFIKLVLANLNQEAFLGHPVLDFSDQLTNAGYRFPNKKRTVSIQVNIKRATNNNLMADIAIKNAFTGEFVFPKNTGELEADESNAIQQEIDLAKRTFARDIIPKILASIAINTTLAKERLENIADTKAQLQIKLAQGEPVEEQLTQCIADEEEAQTNLIYEQLREAQAINAAADKIVALASSDNKVENFKQVFSAETDESDIICLCDHIAYIKQETEQALAIEKHLDELNQIALEMRHIAKVEIPTLQQQETIADDEAANLSKEPILVDIEAAKARFNLLNVKEKELRKEYNRLARLLPETDKETFSLETVYRLERQTGGSTTLGFLSRTLTCDNELFVNTPAFEEELNAELFLMKQDIFSKVKNNPLFILSCTDEQFKWIHEHPGYDALPVNTKLNAIVRNMLSAPPYKYDIDVVIEAITQCDFSLFSPEQQRQIIDNFKARLKQESSTNSIMDTTFSCPPLTFRACAILTDDDLKVVLTELNRLSRTKNNEPLKQLSLIECPLLTEKMIPNNLALNLEKLTISGCLGVKKLALKARNLIAISLTNLPQLNRVEIKSKNNPTVEIQHCDQLRRMRLIDSQDSFKKKKIEYDFYNAVFNSTKPNKINDAFLKLKDKLSDPSVFIEDLTVVYALIEWCQKNNDTQKNIEVVNLLAKNRDNPKSDIAAACTEAADLIIKIHELDAHLHKDPVIQLHNEKNPVILPVEFKADDIAVLLQTINKFHNLIESIDVTNAYSLTAENLFEILKEIVDLDIKILLTPDQKNQLASFMQDANIPNIFTEHQDLSLVAPSSSTSSNSTTASLLSVLGTSSQLGPEENEHPYSADEINEPSAPIMDSPSESSTSSSSGPSPSSSSESSPLPPSPSS